MYEFSIAPFLMCTRRDDIS